MYYQAIPFVGQNGQKTIQTNLCTRVTPNCPRQGCIILGRGVIVGTNTCQSWSVKNQYIYNLFFLFNVLSHDKENEGEGGGDCYGPLDNLEDAAEM